MFVAATTQTRCVISSSLPFFALTKRPVSIMESRAAVSAAFILSSSSISKMRGCLSATRSHSPALEVAEPTSHIALSPAALSISHRNSVLASAGGPVSRTWTGFSASSEALRRSFTSGWPIISSNISSGRLNF
ncbi:hypothetical protein ES703_94061 [subsurface metagenome]